MDQEVSDTQSCDPVLLFFGTRLESHPRSSPQKWWKVKELPVKPGMFSLYGTLDVPWSSDLLQVFRAAAWHCGSWRMGRSWIPAPVCARMRWAEVPRGMRPWQWERGGSEMVKKNEQHVIVDDPTETDLCIFHDILMSTSLKLVCAYLLGHLWGRSSEQSPCFFWHFFQLAETMLSRSAVPEKQPQEIQ